ncbi:HGGxSTG domain-containing protein [Lichenihabitans sp. PAMC28606]|uniref:HGGxSTG domain-containing protein n=1 Tax=Lichenihabitans sp. PAMC28606 TaxID=2880932 RepID=UPI0029CAB07F|nr:HGGxSTG domain-containing protein [Lichenihabitans sp. PAMC28606]
MHARFNTPKCGARTRLGNFCRSPAVAGRVRCRMHGGADRIGAPFGPANGQYRHGRYTYEAVAERRAVREMLRKARRVLALLDP